MTRHSDPSRSEWLRTSSLGVGVLLVLALVVFVNYFGWKYHQRFDWTAGELYTLSEKSLQVLSSLDSDIEIVVLLDPASPLFTATKELVDRYDAASPRLRVEVVDPQRNPARARQLVERFEVTSLSSVVFDDGEDRRIVDEADLAEYDYSAVQYGQEPVVVSFKGEQLFTGAILELVEGRKPKILFVSGHGESGLDDFGPTGLSSAQELLGRDNFAMETWSSLGKAEVPDGTDLIVLAAPKVPLLAAELDLLQRFVAAGGRLLVLAEPVLGTSGLESTGLAEWLSELGIELGRDVVVDPRNPLPLFGAESFFVEDFLQHPITEALQQARYPVLLTLARSVRPAEARDGVLVQELFRTSAEGWGETDLVDLETVEVGDEDTPGPVSLAVAITLETGTPGADGPDRPPDDAGGEGAEQAARSAAGRMVVVGDVDFATNARLPQVGNPTLLLNITNWLVERPNLLGIPPKQAQEVRLSLSRSDLSAIWWLVVVGMPLASLLAGATVYFQRRR